MVIKSCVTCQHVRVAGGMSFCTLGMMNECGNKYHVGWKKREIKIEVEQSKTGTTEEAKQLVTGVGTDSPTVTNEKGGKQSAVSYAFDALDGQAMFAMCKVLHEGRIKYGSDENWRKIPAREHWNHMVIHAFAWITGDRSDDHLSHIMCRAMFLYTTAKAV